jgi:hypothetical protein
MNVLSHGVRAADVFVDESEGAYTICEKGSVTECEAEVDG